ncbi:hypothetical protein SteCoe_25866 [Stentor coeruleus]|uniref:Tyrosine-protein kinase ephrin type A/B receptor-like domain-containing protein n=1 Tax=Stentor coeruleus TaxID=5963 RepID=A0A1R2BE97_9CILI|nr:hypothetical protein SteCoe_25866 [Stentor coeruleus]
MASSMKITRIPQSGNPPDRLSGSSAVYDPIMNQIITFGGFEYRSSTMISSIFTFDLSFLTWGEIKAQSSFVPDGHSSSCLYLRPDRKLLVFFGLTSSGISSEVYSFNLDAGIWKSEDLTGDLIRGRDHPSFTSFTYQSVNYVAFFGGQTSKAIENILYIINTETLQVRKMPQNGDFPSKKIGSSLCFWNNHLLLYGYYPDSLNKATYKDVWSYSLETETWAILNITGQKPLERLYHTAYVYLDYMLIFFGLKIDPPLLACKDIWKLDLNELKWIQVDENLSDLRLESGVIGINSSLYFVYGRDEYMVFNSILVFDLTQDIIKSKHLVTTWDPPIKRMYHCSFRSGNFMYIFGGMTEVGVYLNDMWKFDLENFVWSSVTMQGKVPSPRASFACNQPNGDIFVLYGGKDNDNVYSDLYTFRAATNYWTEFTSLTNSPAPRYNACMANDNYKVYIIGGQNTQTSFKEIWYYDYIKLSYIYVSKYLSFSIIKHKCWASKKNGSVVLNIIGGGSFEDHPNLNWYQIEIDDNFYNISIKLSSDYFINTDNDLIVAEEHFYIIYGSIMSKYVKSDIVKVKIITGEIEIINLPQDSGTYGHSACHWKDAIYVFGGGRSQDAFRLENSATNILNKLDNSDGKSDIECSIGTIQPDCTPCPAGKYYYNKQCVPCPKGKFSPKSAALGEEQCIPCSYGSYSNQIGSYFCLDCPSGYQCPLGSINPKNDTNNLKKKEIHPGYYKRKTSYVSNIVYQLIFFSLILCVIFTFLMLVFKGTWKDFEIIDLFSRKHRQDLEIPVVYKRTSLGGLLSSFFIFISFALVAGSIVTYFLDNITEIKSLMPSITLDIDIKSELFIVESKFYIYGGVCTIDSSCNPNINAITSGISYSTMTISCKKIKDDECQITLKFSNFSSDSTLSTITLSLKEKTSYAGFFTVNFTSSSSIPESFSSVFIPVFSPSSEYVFKGPNPTLVYLRLIPSLFTSDFSKWKSLDTGYHLQIDEDPKIGSLASQNIINFQMYLYIQLLLYKSETGLNTQRIINNNWITTLGGLLGTIFGLMNSLSFIMIIIETFKDSYNKKTNRETFVKMISHRAKLFKSEFGCYKIKCKDAKVLPLEINTED